MELPIPARDQPAQRQARAARREFSQHCQRAGRLHPEQRFRVSCATAFRHSIEIPVWSQGRWATGPLPFGSTCGSGKGHQSGADASRRELVNRPPVAAAALAADAV
jgi:hypothetical protein